MYKKTIILASAILAVTVMTSMIAGQVFALLASPPSETFTGGAGGIGEFRIDHKCICTKSE